jgi:hypothetical protein
MGGTSGNRIVPILIAVVIAIFVATLETFAKIVFVVFRVYVIAVKAIGRVIIFGSFLPEAFGWFAPPKLTRVWEPTLLWNQLRS